MSLVVRAEFKMRIIRSINSTIWIRSLNIVGDRRMVLILDTNLSAVLKICSEIFCTWENIVFVYDLVFGHVQEGNLPHMYLI